MFIVNRAQKIPPEHFRKCKGVRNRRRARLFLPMRSLKALNETSGATLAAAAAKL